MAAKKKAWTQADRRKMPKGCFLQPGERKYPFCKKGAKKVKTDCRTALRAFSRARQQKQNATAKKALRKGVSAGCSWTETGAAAQRLRKRYGF